MAEWCEWWERTIPNKWIEVFCKVFQDKTIPYDHLFLLHNSCVDAKAYQFDLQSQERSIICELYELAVQHNCLMEMLYNMLNFKFLDTFFPVQEYMDVVWTIPGASSCINFKDIKLNVLIYKIFMHSNVMFNKQKNAALNVELKTSVYLDRVLGVSNVSDLILGYL